jgi:hypothetical protein
MNFEEADRRNAVITRIPYMGNDRIELITRPKKWYRSERWFWRIASPNGQTLATSEMYKSKQARDDSAKRQATLHNYDLISIGLSNAPL